MISEETYMELHILKKQGKSIREISRCTGLSRNTARKYLQSEKPYYHPRPPKAHKLDPYKSYLQQRVADAKPNWIPGTVLLSEIQQQGYSGGISRLRDYLLTLKPKSIEEVVIRYETDPGIQMQVDWALFGGRGKQRIVAFVATLGYSRASFVEFAGDEQLETLLRCHQHAFDYFGGVPADILYDNMKTVVTCRNAYGKGRHQFNSRLWDFARHYGFNPRLCQPYRAQTKGKVERFIHYLRHSFFTPLAAQCKSTGQRMDIDILNSKGAIWLHDVANTRTHGTTGKVPVEQLQIEQPFLQGIPSHYEFAPPKAEIISLQHPLRLYDSLLEEVG